MDPSKSYYYQNPQFSANYGYTYSYPSTNIRSTIMGTVSNICRHIPVKELDRLLQDAKKRRDTAQIRVNDAKTAIAELKEAGEPVDKATENSLKKAEGDLKEPSRDLEYYSALKRLKNAEETKTNPLPPDVMRNYREAVEQYEKNMPEHLRLLLKKPEGGDRENENGDKTSKAKKE